MLSAESLRPDLDRTAQSTTELSSAELHDSRERLQLGALESVKTIHNELDPVTGLLPAASVTTGQYEPRYRMGCAWDRDIGAIIASLSKQEVLTQFPEDTETGYLVRDIVRRASTGVLDVMAKDPWRELLRAPVLRSGKNGEHTYGTNFDYTYVPIDPKTGVEQAPPPHFSLDGQPCQHENDGRNGKRFESPFVPWYTPHQPDGKAWVLLGVSQAARNGVLDLTGRQEEALEDMAHHLINVNLPRGEYSHAWEALPVRDPAPLSTVYIGARALRAAQPYYVHDAITAKEAERAIRNNERYVPKQFPIEYSQSVGHTSTTDLAELFPLALNDHEDPISLAGFLAAAHAQGMHDSFYGMIRFVGDTYCGGDLGSAYWYMANPLRGIAAFHKAEKLLAMSNADYAVHWYDYGHRMTRRAFDHRAQFGYPRELYTPNTDGIVPSRNNLLWNHALDTQAFAMDLELQDRLAA